MAGQQNLIEHDQVILAGDGANLGQTYTLSKDSPNFVRAWRVEVHGAIRSNGQDVTIVAQEVLFVGADAVIDTSGIDAVNQWVAGNRPLTPDSAGKDGTAGQSGLPGGSAGNFVLFASKIGGIVSIKACGGRGGRGQDGGDGTDGGPPEHRNPEPYPDCLLHGFPGHNGGRGGKAGAPGTSGRGGNVDIWLSVQAGIPTIVADLKGGAAPEAANPGKSAQGGAGGPPPGCSSPSGQGHGGTGGMVHVPNGYHATLAGRNGLPGAPPDAQILPTAGASGLLNGELATASPLPPCHLLADDTFAKNCSPQQLWATLQQAEELYLNENINEAGPRLAWVSLMGRLMGQNTAVPHA